MTDLSTIYSIWDNLGNIPVINNSQNEPVIDEDFYKFSKGHNLYDIWHFLEGQNSRFTIAEVQQGLRLTPLESSITNAPFSDSKGNQICIGDIVKVNTRSGNGLTSETVQIEMISDKLKRMLYASETIEITKRAQPEHVSDQSHTSGREKPKP